MFGWRRLAKRGLLRAPDPSSAQLLPVTIESPTVLPNKKPGPVAPPSELEPGYVEIELTGGIRVRVRGTVEAATLKHVFDALPRR